VTAPGAKEPISPRLPEHGLECVSFDAIRTPNAFLFVSFCAPLVQVSPRRLTRLSSMIATLHFLYMKENGTAVGAEMALVTFCCLPTLPRSDCRLEAGSNAQRQGIRKLKSPDLTGIGAAPEGPRKAPSQAAKSVAPLSRTFIHR